MIRMLEIWMVGLALLWALHVCCCFALLHHQQALLYQCVKITIFVMCKQ